MRRMPDAPQYLRFPGRIGLGTWKMGASHSERAHEIAAISHALTSGYRLIDTAELYADGGAERLIGGALKSFGAARRAELFIVSKVMPGNASRRGTIRACEESIARLGCDYLDLYLLHWRGSHPFRETLQAFQDLQQRGLIRHFGVSNLDVADLEEWVRAERQLGAGEGLRCNQLYYSLETRGIEYALLPWQRARGISTMAYSPLGQGELASHPALAQIGRERGLSAAQIALAWTIREPDVVAIPKSVQPHRIDENLAAAQVHLSAAELAKLDQLFPAPQSKRPLATA
jgi:diketogulonate reductase-like aldo/keto reductase